MKQKNHYFLGIDGGGTKTVFRLVGGNGSLIREIRKGAVNPNDIGMETACTILKDGITDICKDIPFSSVTMFAGIAGGGMSGDNARILHHFFGRFGFFAYDNGSDIENIIALSDEDPRILVIMGTGFIVYALSGTERKRIAGWGQFFDDGGSGYTLGKDAITAVLCEGDGSGTPTLLTKLFERRLGETAEEHLAKFYQGGKRYIAGFADLIFEAAKQNDTVAKEILEKNFAFVAQKIDTATEALRKIADNSESIPVFFAGGITGQSETVFPIIENHLKNRNVRLISLTNEPIEGAVRQAHKIFETNTEQKGIFL